MEAVLSHNFELLSFGLQGFLDIYVDGISEIDSYRGFLAANLFWTIENHFIHPSIRRARPIPFSALDTIRKKAEESKNNGLLPRQMYVVLKTVACSILEVLEAMKAGWAQFRPAKRVAAVESLLSIAALVIVLLEELNLSLPDPFCILLLQVPQPQLIGQPSYTVLTPTSTIQEVRDWFNSQPEFQYLTNFFQNDDGASLFAYTKEGLLRHLDHLGNPLAALRLYNIIRGPVVINPADYHDKKKQPASPPRSPARHKRTKNLDSPPPCKKEVEERAAKRTLKLSAPESKSKTKVHSIYEKFSTSSSASTSPRPKGNSRKKHRQSDDVTHHIQIRPPACEDTNSRETVDDMSVTLIVFGANKTCSDERLLLKCSKNVPSSEESSPGSPKSGRSSPSGLSSSRSGFSSPRNQDELSSEAKRKRTPSRFTRKRKEGQCSSASTGSTTSEAATPEGSSLSVIRAATVHAESKLSLEQAFYFIRRTNYTNVLSDPVKINFSLKQLVILITYLLSQLSLSEEIQNGLSDLKEKVQQNFIKFSQSNDESLTATLKQELILALDETQQFLNLYSQAIVDLIRSSAEMEEDYLSLWDEDSGLCGVKQPREGDFVSWDSELWIDVEVQDIIKSMNNVAFMVRYASLNHLLILLTHSNYYDPNFLKIFFSTYLTFTTPLYLFKKLYFRFRVPADGDTLGKTIKTRVVNAFKFWMNNRFVDFTPELIQKMQIFIGHLKTEKHPAFVSLNNLFTRLVSGAVQEIPVISVTVDPPFPAKKILKCSAEEIAQHLCLASFDLWSKLKPTDLLAQSNLNAAPYVSQLSSHFNGIVQWVSSLILEQEKLSKRVKVLIKFIEVGLELEKLNNFNGLFALSCAINNSAIIRLKWTFAEVPERLIQEWKAVGELLIPLQNYSAYRAHIRSRNPPLVPFLGQYLTDLTMIKDGNPDLNQESGLLNFHKRQLLYKVISEMELSQLTPYSFKNSNRGLYTLLSNLPSYDEATMNDQLYAQSLAREPRNIQNKKQLPGG